jgi:chemotaxis signal transduction protein
MVRDEEEQFVAFYLGGETYALPITTVQEIIRRSRILPHGRA